MIKRITTAFLLLLSGSLLAQQANEAAPARKAMAISLSNYTASAQKGPGTQVTPTALWDIQDFYALDTICSTAGGFAGICWTGSEWWVSQWNKDSLYTLDANGNLTASFKITGVGTAASGVRSMTFDGTTLYAADNTGTPLGNAIHEGDSLADPVSKFVVAFSENMAASTTTWLTPKRSSRNCLTCGGYSVDVRRFGVLH